MKGFSVKETEQLISMAKISKINKSKLVKVFQDFANEHNRKFGSVRNYYYQYIKQNGMSYGELKVANLKYFTKCETVAIIKEILVNTFGGASVRQVIIKMADGDSKLALRLQNKYRNEITFNRKLVESIMQGLKMQNVSFKNPYEKKTNTFLYHRLSGEIDNLFEKIALREKQLNEQLKKEITELKQENEELKKSKIFSVYKKLRES